MFSTFCSFLPLPPSSSAHNYPAARTGRTGKGGLGEAPRERVSPPEGFSYRVGKVANFVPSSPVVSPAAPAALFPTCLETEQGSMGTLAPARPIDAGRISAPEARRRNARQRLTGEVALGRWIPYGTPQALPSDPRRSGIDAGRVGTMASVPGRLEHRHGERQRRPMAPGREQRVERVW